MQAAKSVKDLSTELKTTQNENNDLWGALQRVANLVRVQADVEMSWAQFIPSILERFDNYVPVAARTCVESVLA